MTSHLFLHFILAEITASHLYLQHTKERLNFFVLVLVYIQNNPRRYRTDGGLFNQYWIFPLSKKKKKKKSGYLAQGVEKNSVLSLRQEIVFLLLSQRVS